MAQFTADIAGMLEVCAIAAGLVLLHRAGKEAPAELLKAAGWVLVAGGVPGMMHGPGPGTGPGMMGPGMMSPGAMPHGMTPPSDQPPEEAR